MNKVTINGVDICPFSSREELINCVDKNKLILVAVNAEKILHANDQTREIINSNIGYCDGIFTVMALKQKGVKDVIKIPGCELWLDIVSHFEGSKSFILLGQSKK